MFGDSAVGTNRCFYCGSDGPLRMSTLPDGRTLNDAGDSGFAGFNTTKVESLCLAPSIDHQYMERGRLDGTAAWNTFGAENWCHGCLRADLTVDPWSRSPWSHSRRPTTTRWASSTVGFPIVLWRRHWSGAGGRAE